MAKPGSSFSTRCTLSEWGLRGSRAPQLVFLGRFFAPSRGVFVCVAFMYMLIKYIMSEGGMGGRKNVSLWVSTTRSK